MLIDSELKEKNFEIYSKKLSSLASDNFNPSSILEKYGELLKNASFASTNETGTATEGSLIAVVLRIITPYAVKLNELLPESIRVDQSVLVKICLLQHISKAIRLIPNDNQWEVEKRQMIYKFNPDLPIAVGTGLHSVILLNELGISLTPEEVEAMTIIDRDIADKQAKYYCTTLSALVRQANEMAYLQLSKTNQK